MTISKWRGGRPMGTAVAPDQNIRTYRTIPRWGGPARGSGDHAELRRGWSPAARRSRATASSWLFTSSFARTERTQRSRASALSIRRPDAAASGQHRVEQLRQGHGLGGVARRAGRDRGGDAPLVGLGRDQQHRAHSGPQRDELDLVDRARSPPSAESATGSRL